MNFRVCTKSWTTELSSTLLAALLCLPLSSQGGEPDPLGSPMWNYLFPGFIGADADYQFDKRVVVSAPEFAEDSSQVPITINAVAFREQLQKIVVWADLNPIQHIFTYYPDPVVEPIISMRIRVQQGTPIRAAVQTTDNSWHIGYTFIDATGGGCTAPTLAAANPYWENHLGEVESAQFTRADTTRYRFRVIHPMDTGLVDAVPEFFIEQLEIRDASNTKRASMELYPPISENPVFTFDINDDSQSYTLWMRDNGGNIFETAL